LLHPSPATDTSRLPTLRVSIFTPPLASVLVGRPIRPTLPPIDAGSLGRMGELGDAYHGARTRVIDLVTAAGDSEVSRIAPATPEWTVKDILAHLAGITTDIVHGNLTGIATDEWTAAQVDARRTCDVDELLAEWDTHASTVEAMVDQFGRAGDQLVTDAVTHEHDIRGALDRPGARDTDAVQIGFDFVGTTLGEVLDAAGTGALRVEHEAGATTFGADDPTTTLRTTRFEFLRATTGRRCHAQVAAYDWDGGTPPDGLVLALFTVRTDPLEEPSPPEK
jgi:uncharacterized protein (TIGR03083 family)